MAPAPLSTRRCAREPRTVCALSLHTPSQWMRAHCRGQYTKCSIAEIEMMGASITGVQNRILSSDPICFPAQVRHSAKLRVPLFLAKWFSGQDSKRP